MNNFMIALKRFFRNKNMVTIIGVIAIILILFVGYRIQIDRKVNPVPDIPIAAMTIQPRTKITPDMIEYVDVAPVVLRNNVIRSSNAIIGKYSNYNTVIPKGSMFYSGVVVNQADLPDAALVEVAKGEVPYYMSVTLDKTYGNSIYPGNYIDIYMKAVNENGQLMVGKLVENVKVLAVKDSSGRDVFENNEETRLPSSLIYGVKPEINILLLKAKYMTAFSADLFPVPHGGTANIQDGATEVSSQTLRDFINANTVPNDELNAAIPQEG